jgi:hypothetical protein
MKWKWYKRWRKKWTPCPNVFFLPQSQIFLFANCCPFTMLILTVQPVSEYGVGRRIKERREIKLCKPSSRIMHPPEKWLIKYGTPSLTQPWGKTFQIKKRVSRINEEQKLW